MLMYDRTNEPDVTGTRRIAPAAHPTDALPGTPEKVEVLRQRARLRQELWHPRDARLPTPVGDWRPPEFAWPFTAPQFGDSYHGDRDG